MFVCVSAEEGEASSGGEHEFRNRRRSGTQQSHSVQRSDHILCLTTNAKQLQYSEIQHYELFFHLALMRTSSVA